MNDSNLKEKRPMLQRERHLSVLILDPESNPVLGTGFYCVCIRILDSVHEQHQIFMILVIFSRVSRILRRL
jgi:hypothetical protein